MPNNIAAIFILIFLLFTLYLLLRPKQRINLQEHVDMTGRLSPPRIINLNDVKYSSLMSQLHKYVRNPDPDVILMGRMSELLNAYLWSLKNYCTSFTRNLRVCYGQHHEHIDIYGGSEYFCPDEVGNIICRVDEQPDLEIRTDEEEFLSSAHHKLLDMSKHVFREGKPIRLNKDFILPLSDELGVISIADSSVRSLAERFLIKIRGVTPEVVSPRVLSERVKSLERVLAKKVIRNDPYAIIDMNRDFFLSKGVSVLADEKGRSKLCLTVPERTFNELIRRLHRSE